MDKELIKIFVEAFIENEFSETMKKKLKNFEEKNREGLLDYCIDKAWNDTIAYERYKKESIVKDNAKEIKDTFKKEITNFNSEIDFDNWHNTLCEKNSYGMKCGLWQKLINMTFKYLYCLAQFDYKWIDDSIFDNCHMPLDSYTLNWYYNNVDKNANKIKWNNIKSYKEYQNIQTNIKKTANLSGYTPLQYEFIIWQLEKNNYNFDNSKLIFDFLIQKIMITNPNTIPTLEELKRNIEEITNLLKAK